MLAKKEPRMKQSNPTIIKWAI